MSVLLYGCTTQTNQMPAKKARWELHKKTACCSEQIPEAAVIQPLTFHLINHSGYCWELRVEHISDVFLRTPTHGHTNDSQPVDIHQLWADTGCCLKDLQRAVINRNEGQEKESQMNPCWWHTLIIIMSHCHHGSPRSSLATCLYRPLLPGGLPSYILY